VFKFLPGQQIRFGQEDNRFHPSIRSHDQVPLQPVGIEIEMARLDNEGDVDVGGDHLLIVAAACGPAPQVSPARKDLVNDGGPAVVVILRRDPVTDARQVRGLVALVEELSGQLRRHVAGLVSEAVRTAIDGADAGDRAALGL